MKKFGTFHGSSWVWRIFAGILVVSIVVFMTRHFVFGSGFPYTHDGENHLARFMNFSAALREGQFPPRFAPYLFHGFGFPVFNYNYPLANILAAPLLWIGFTPGKAFTLIGVSAMLTGSLATYVLLHRNFSPVSSLIGAAWFASSAYMASAWIFRGSIGEILAYSMIPLVILGFEWSLRNTKVWWSFLCTVFLGCFFLSHNVVVLMVSPFLLLWSLSLAWEMKKMRRGMLIWFAGFGLSAWFWIPAILELSLIVLQSDSLAQSAVTHILSIGQFFFSPLQFGFSRSTFVDSLGFGLGWGTAILALILASWFLRLLVLNVHESRTHAYRTQLLLVVAAMTSFFLATELSTFLWESVPFLSIIQFPWRWQLLFSLVMVFGVAALWQRGSTILRGIILVCLILNLQWIAPLKPADFVNHANDHYLSFPHTTTTRNEDRPKTLTTEDLGSWEPKPIILGNAELVSVERWLGSTRTYTVLVHEDTIIEEPTVYFPGWMTTDQRGERYSYDLSSSAKGLIRYRLLARDEPYQITSRFQEKSLPRMLGEGITGITLLGFLGLLAWQGRKLRSA